MRGAQGNCLSYPLGGLVTAAFGREYGIQHIMLVLALAVPGSALLWLTIRHFRARFEGVPPPLAGEPKAVFDQVVSSN